MAGKVRFTIGTLAAVGFSSAAASAEPVKNESGIKTVFDDIKNIVKAMTQDHEYELAGHRSHGSHSSHGSHRSSGTGGAGHSSHASHASHRSYLKPPDIDDGEIPYLQSSVVSESTTSRNERSTPRSSVLPSSPAIARKLKRLPGNSSKFTDIVRSAQLALLIKGYDVGSINGQLHAKTMSAVFKFQRDHSLAPDGRLTSEVLTSLNLSAR